MLLKNIFADLKKFNWGLFVALCLVEFVPAIYDTIRTYFLAINISTAEFDVIAQMEWYELINEIMVAFLIVPLYAVFNGIYKKISNKYLSYFIFHALITVIILYTIFALCVYFYGENLINSMNKDIENTLSIKTYLQLETIAFNVKIIITFTNVVLVVINKKKNMYFLLLIDCILSIMGDFILIPNYGVNGVAYSNILINFVMALVSIIILLKEKMIKPNFFDEKDLFFYKSWLKEGIFAGLQSLLDNLIYIYLIVRMVNSVKEQSNYWLANNFIYLWLLIPVTALSQVIKGDCKSKYIDLKQSNYYIVGFLIVCIWLLFLPTWKYYFRDVVKLNNYDAVLKILYRLFVFYIFYIFSTIPDSIFDGIGKLKYLYYNSLFVNLLYFGNVYLLYKILQFPMSIENIIFIFGFSLVVHEIISLLEQKILLRKDILKELLLKDID